jgi:hypothetical protein
MAAGDSLPVPCGTPAAWGAVAGEIGGLSPIREVWNILGPHAPTSPN